MTNIQALEVRTHFAASVRRWRYQRGLSQEELAERADLHRTYISDVERGARNLSLESINKLAAALEISLPDLFAHSDSNLREALGPSSRLTGANTPFVHLLIVEDNPDDVELTLRAFKRVRMSNPIHVARDGSEALEYFFGPSGVANAIARGRNQVVLLDLNLPKVNGTEVLRRLKADPRTTSVPVILLTASDDEQDMTTCQRLGAAAYITKPVNLQGLSKVTPELCLVWALIKPMPQSVLASQEQSSRARIAARKV